jgi:hypothetical protein
MSVLLADVLRWRRASRYAIGLLVRVRAVQRGKNRVRCGCLRCHAPAARRDRDRHDVWHAGRRRCPLGTRTRSREQRRLHRTVIDRLDHAVTRSRGDRRPWHVRTRTSTNTPILRPTRTTARGEGESCAGRGTDGGTFRRSPPRRDAGASLCPCDVWIAGSLVAARRDARPRCSVGTRDESLRTHTCRSPSRDFRRRPARVRVHPVRRARVPSGTRLGPGGASA